MFFSLTGIPDVLCLAIGIFMPSGQFLYHKAAGRAGDASRDFDNHVRLAFFLLQLKKVLLFFHFFVMISKLFSGQQEGADYDG